MSETTTQTSSNLPATVPTPTPKPERVPVQFNADDPISLYMDSNIFAQLQRVALMMAKANLVPAHLRGDEKVSDCFLVAAQAFRWRMDPFSVAQHTFVTQGKLGYEGKLIAGLINASGKLQSNLKPVYSEPAGGDSRAVAIVGRIRGEAEDRTIEGTVGGWKTTNEKWKTMPDQMLFYRGAREWARRHMPEVMLGISADEEVVEMERAPEGGYQAAPRLAVLTERLQAENGGGEAVATQAIPTPDPPAGAAKGPFAEAVDAAKKGPKQGRLTE